MTNSNLSPEHTCGGHAAGQVQHHPEAVRLLLGAAQTRGGDVSGGNVGGDVSVVDGGDVSDGGEGVHGVSHCLVTAGRTAAPLLLPAAAPLISAVLSCLLPHN